MRSRDFFLPFRLHLWLLWHTLSLVTDEIGKKDGERGKKMLPRLKSPYSKENSNITHSLFLFQVRFKTVKPLPRRQKNLQCGGGGGERTNEDGTGPSSSPPFPPFPSAYYLFMHTRTNGLFGKPPSVGCQFGKESHTFSPLPSCLLKKLFPHPD